MTRRQIIAEEWLIVDRNTGDELWSAVRKLPRGSGILLLALLDPKDCRRLRRLAQSRDLTIVVEAPRSAARVHNMRELTRARLRRTPMLLLSPLYPTSSHPQWQPLDFSGPRIPSSLMPIPPKVLSAASALMDTFLSSIAQMLAS